MRLKFFLVCCLSIVIQLSLKAQSTYPTLENHVSGLIRSGLYDDAIHALEENLHWFKNDTSKTELFNWLSSLYLHRKQWDKFITLYENHVFLPGEDSTLLSGARFYRNFHETLSTGTNEKWVKYHTGLFGRTPKIKIRVNGKKYRFWVDTGAGLSVVTDKTARKCGLKQYTPGGGSAMSATGTQVNIWYAVIDSLQGAGLKVKNHPCLVLHKNDLKFRLLGITLVKIHGIIGWNLLQELAVDVDFKSKKLRMVRPVDPVTQTNNNFFWMEQPLVEVEGDNHSTLNFLLDTGASGSGLYQAIYGKTDTSTAVTQTITLGSAGGMRTIKTKVFPEIKLTVSGQTLVMKNLAVQPMPYNEGGFVRHGVLGIKELEPYRLHFSMPEGVFRLIPR